MLVSADQRVLRGVAATLSWQPVGSDGEPAAPSGAVTVGVVNAAGSVVVASGTATTGSGTAPRTAALTAAQTANLDLLTVTWTDAGDGSAHTTLVEIVGGYYFSVAEARASDATLADATKYPSATIVQVRGEVEVEFEDIIGAALVPRFASELVHVHDGIILRWPYLRAVRTVETWLGTEYEAWTDLTEIYTTPSGRLSGHLFSPGARYRIGYEHGLDRPSATLKAAALTRLRDRLNWNLRGIPDRATSFAVSEGGTYRMDQAGTAKTGIPDVDAALARARAEAFPGFA